MGKLNQGQILLVVVLTMIVALTVGLSLVSRTITNLKISKQNEESQRAFQAAEAGIERALQSALEGTNLQFSNNASFSTSITTLSGTGFLLNAGDNVDQDTGIDVWLATYPDYTAPLTGSVTIYWSTSIQTSCLNTGGETVKAALEIDILSGAKANPVLSKFVYDSCGRINGATNPGAGGVVSNVTFSHAATIPVVNGLIMRLIPIYNSTKIGITSNVPLPEQGKIIESVGESGETVRRVQYFSSHPQIPLEVFPYSVISQ